MPKISVGAQVFDIVFHPTQQTVFLGLLTGDIKAFNYSDDGTSKEIFSVRPSKKSCRGLTLSDDGLKLHAVGKGKSLCTLDTVTGQIIETKPGIHNSPINRIKQLFPHILCTGDDDGVMKLWDNRQEEAVKTYNHHFDFISDFLWIENKRHVVATSGDGTLSVMDIRATKGTPVAHSEDQEDELLSIIPIRKGEKFVVGTQLGILSIFNRTSGWGDCVDRVPGHPHSIDALCNLPASFSNAQSTILTGSSDGLLRVVELFPTKLIGSIADHGDFPIERIAVDMNGEGRWCGSVGHDEALHLTDLRDALEDDEHDEDEQEDEQEEEEAEKNSSNGAASESDGDLDEERPVASNDVEDDDEEGVSTAMNMHRKKRRRKDQDILGADDRKKKKGKKDVDTEASFFAGL